MLICIYLICYFPSFDAGATIGRNKQNSRRPSSITTTITLWIIPIMIWLFPPTHRLHLPFFPLYMIVSVPGAIQTHLHQVLHVSRFVRQPLVASLHFARLRFRYSSPRKLLLWFIHYSSIHKRSVYYNSPRGRREKLNQTNTEACCLFIKHDLMKFEVRYRFTAASLARCWPSKPCWHSNIPSVRLNTSIVYEVLSISTDTLPLLVSFFPRSLPFDSHFPMEKYHCWNIGILWRDCSSYTAASFIQHVRDQSDGTGFIMVKNGFSMQRSFPPF